MINTKSVGMDVYLFNYDQYNNFIYQNYEKLIGNYSTVYILQFVIHNHPINN